MDHHLDRYRAVAQDFGPSSQLHGTWMVDNATGHIKTLQGKDCHADVFSDAKYFKGVADQVHPKGSIRSVDLRFC